MAIETKSKSIGEYTYTVQGHGAIKGRALLLRLSKVVGASLTGISKANAAAAIGQLVGALSEDDLTLFCDEFAKKTTVAMGEGEVQLSKIFDVHFAGEYLALCEWLAFCIELNFSSFFTDAKRLLAAPALATPAAAAKA